MKKILFKLRFYLNFVLNKTFETSYEFYYLKMKNIEKNTSQQVYSNSNYRLDVRLSEANLLRRKQINR